MTARILTGTCSWADKSLVDCHCFYPPEAKTPDARLRFYASRFPIVEVDSSYYGLPSENNSALWVERTPQEFTFDIKAFRLLTHHPTPPEALTKELRAQLPPALRERRSFYYRDVPPEVRDEVWRLFAEALLPLDSAGKLGTVLFQFPPWFLPNRENRAHILEAQARLPQYRVAVELRSASWFGDDAGRERTIDFFRQHAIPLVTVDEPQGFESSIPPIAEATANIAIVRFHGRNRDMWDRRGATVSDRFDYLYTEEELREWVSPVRRLAESTREVHLLMNNCVRDKAVVNASQLRTLLES